MADNIRDSEGDELLDTSDTARFLKLAESTLHEKRVDGSGPPFIKLTPGRRGAVRYRKQDLLKWIESKLVSSTSEAA